MGLEALLRDMTEKSAARDALRDLVEMADLSVKDLRSYADGLRAGPRSDRTLLAAVREQANRYERFYGMHVDVRIESVGVPPHIAAEVFHIISEGLSNVRRHTHSNRASVSVRRKDCSLRVEVCNESADPVAAGFRPRSIQQRVAMLGGTVSVAAEGGETTVSVSVPL
jgi:signal transduction histidine kinase